jgi:hypothetical protein
MTFTLDLPAELEQRLIRRAEESGADPKAFVTHLVERYLSARTLPFVALTEEETKLFRRVNQTPPLDVRARWRELDGIRRLAQLDPHQQLELTALYDQIEANHVQRLAAAGQLAKRRGVTLDVMLEQLGLSSDADE